MKISVIIPAYNSEKTISSALESVFCQTCQDMEVIVVDDCSTDGTLGIISGFRSHPSSLHVLPQDINSGPAAARNRGIKEATGEWIAFLDADDEWY